MLNRIADGSERFADLGGVAGNDDRRAIGIDGLPRDARDVIRTHREDVLGRPAMSLKLYTAGKTRAWKFFVSSSSDDSPDGRYGVRDTVPVMNMLLDTMPV